MAPYKIRALLFSSLQLIPLILNVTLTVFLLFKLLLLIKGKCLSQCATKIMITQDIIYIGYNNLNQMAREYNWSIYTILTLINIESILWSSLLCLSANFKGICNRFEHQHLLCFHFEYYEIQLIRWWFVSLFGCINSDTIKSHWRTKWNLGRVNSPSP